MKKPSGINVECPPSHRLYRVISFGVTRLPCSSVLNFQQLWPNTCGFQLPTPSGHTSQNLSNGLGYLVQPFAWRRGGKKPNGSSRVRASAGRTPWAVGSGSAVLFAAPQGRSERVHGGTRALRNRSNWWCFFEVENYDGTKTASDIVGTAWFPWACVLFGALRPKGLDLIGPKRA